MNSKQKAFIDEFVRIKILLLHGDVTILDIYMAVLPIMFGFWLLFPMDSFDSSPIFSSFLFSYLSHTIGEILLGVFSATIGITKLYAILYGKTLMNVISNIAAIFMWGLILFSAIIGNYYLVATVVYAWFFVVSLYLHIRIGENGGG